ncbi:MAG TPA: NAD-dependent epimerase/dehydratase family protein [Gemmatimonadaceae bacterium]|nr:NAD-dependent epimerase/dehydratase family protein [Gemmatimonadaceae bacterium]
MRVVVIGGTGHIGTFLIPRLVSVGHEVIVASRGERQPYLPHPAWHEVRHIEIDRAAEDAAGTFGSRIAALDADALIDLICFTPDSAKQLTDALKPRRTLLLHCGTMWVHGRPTSVPVTEDMPRHPFGDYGIKKAAIEKLLLESTRRGDARATVLHPGHMVGPGWNPVNPAGHFNPDVFTRIAHGETLVLPNDGMETVHHVHADDVAQAFELALNNPDAAVGESFHVVSPAPMSLCDYAEAMYAHFGQEPRLEFLPWEEWKQTVTEEEAAATWDHIAHSPHGSITKARKKLGYSPRYSSLQAVIESVSSRINNQRRGRGT